MGIALVHVGDIVRLAYTREWLGPVIRIDGNDAYVHHTRGDGLVHKHRRDLLFNRPQITRYG